jgi:hypothetical protein
MALPITVPAAGEVYLFDRDTCESGMCRLNASVEYCNCDTSTSEIRPVCFDGGYSPGITASTLASHVTGLYQTGRHGWRDGYDLRIAHKLVSASIVGSLHVEADFQRFGSSLLPSPPAEVAYFSIVIYR